MPCNRFPFTVQIGREIDSVSIFSKLLFVNDFLFLALDSGLSSLSLDPHPFCLQASNIRDGEDILDALLRLKFEFFSRFFRLYFA